MGYLTAYKALPSVSQTTLLVLHSRNEKISMVSVKLCKIFLYEIKQIYDR